HMVTHPEEARAKGRAGRERIVRDFTWERAAAAVEARLRALRGTPVRRAALLSPLAPVVGGEGPGVRGHSQTPSPPTPLPRSGGEGSHAARPRVSLCMIVKDEATNLPSCLRSVADLVDEMIVIDTGSRDGTRQVAERLGARVFDFAWCDDF